MCTITFCGAVLLHVRVHDTAGLRRRSRVEEKLEKLSVADALHAVRFAEVIVLLMDAQRPFEEQDLRIADLIAREGRALVIGINKWDLVERGAGAIKTLREEADHWLPQVKGVPVAAVSALAGEGLDRMMQAVVDAHAVWNRRVERVPSIAGWARSLPPTRRRRLRAGRSGSITSPSRKAAAELRAVHEPRRCPAGGLSALPRQQPARDFRSARHSNSARVAREAKSLRNAAGASLPARRRQRQRPRLAGLAKRPG